MSVDTEMTSVIELADELGKRKQTIFKIIHRLGIETRKMKESTRRGASLAYVTDDDAKRIQQELVLTSPDREYSANSEGTYLPSQKGVFYLVALEPDHDPKRFKVGFATNLSERLRSLRCSAPFIRVVKSWPCKNLWEKTAMECVTEGCERLHTEVFRATSLDSVIAKCENFFALMPKLPE